MLFRYKVKLNKPSVFGNSTLYNHDVKIQMYNENAHVFHWKTISNTTLRSIAYELEPSYDEIGGRSGAELLYSVLTMYKDMNNFVKMYIIRVLGKSWKARNQADEYVDQIFEFAVTDGWNCVEIKEEN